MRNASLVDTIVGGALFDEAEIYGISVWNLKGTPKSGDDLVIVPREAASTWFPPHHASGLPAASRAAWGDV